MRATGRAACCRCEHLTRRVTRTEYDGSITVLADRFDGKRLNSPNDIVCQSNGAVWFTDPPFGILGLWEGNPAERGAAARGLPHRPGRRRAARRCIDRPRGAQRPGVLARRVDALRGREPRRAAPPDLGLRRAAPTARSSTSACTSSANGAGALDGIAVDAAATSGAAGAATVRRPPTARTSTACGCSMPAGKALAASSCPSAARTCVSAARRTTGCSWPASHSLYALYVNVRGAV